MRVSLKLRYHPGDSSTREFRGRKEGRGNLMGGCTRGCGREKSKDETRPIPPRLEGWRKFEREREDR